VTVGIDLFFSIQVTKWKSEEIIAFRNTDRSCIFDVLFNPHDRYEFATVGYHSVSIWGIEGHSTVRKEWIHVKDREEGEPVIFTAATYFNYKVEWHSNSYIIHLVEERDRVRLDSW